MDLLDVILTRRSIRRYTTEKINQEIVNKIIKAGMYAPSAVNKQPWHFIVFEKPETKQAIVDVHKNASMLLGADKAILICYDEDLQHDHGYGPVDCSAATENMLLAAHSLGIGACWIGIYPRHNRIEALHSIFGLPKNVIPFAVISLGYPSEKKEMPDRYKPDRIHNEQW
jgi:nitroreductase